MHIYIDSVPDEKGGGCGRGGGVMAFDHNVFPDGRFSGLLSSFLTTFVMMIGEFEYKELFNQVS
jgi:hypothetical protein